MEIYINREGQQFGPYSLDQVKTHLADGALSGQDFAWAEGQTDWQSLEAMVAGLDQCTMCEAVLEPGQVVCFACGHNQKTGGATLTTAGASTAPTGYRPLEPEAMEQQFRRGYTLLGALLLVGALVPFYSLDQSFNNGEVQTVRKVALPSLDLAHAGWAGWLFKLTPLLAGLAALLMGLVQTLPGNRSPMRGFIVAALLTLPLVGWFVGDDSITSSPMPFNLLMGGKTGALFLAGPVLLGLAGAMRFHRSEHGAAWPLGILGVVVTAVFWFLPANMSSWSPTTMPSYGVVASFQVNGPMALKVLSCLGVTGLLGLHITAAVWFLRKGSFAEPEEQSAAGRRAALWALFSLAVPVVVAVGSHFAEWLPKSQPAWFEHRISFFTELTRDAGLWMGLMGLLSLAVADAIIGVYDKGETSEEAKVIFTPDMDSPPSVDPHVYERPPG